MTSIIKNCKIGENTKIWNFCNVYDCEIGSNTQIGSYCEIKPNAKIGDFCRIQSYVFISDETQIGSYVFIGPRVTFLNDKNPDVEKTLLRKWNLEAVIVEDYVTIGGGTVILPGVKIRKGSFIGAGSVLTKSTNENEMWYGNPAKFIKYLDKK